MPGLVPGIHVFLVAQLDVDGRDKPGHDDGEAAGGQPIGVFTRPSLPSLPR
ncbi:MAG: hypothetical protein V7604_4431 [Hyphomicrobiales bacterium]|jgi:hypothetical protein